MMDNVTKIKDHVPEVIKQELGFKERKKRTTQRVEPRYINKLAKACDGGQTEAAQLLGLSGPAVNTAIKSWSARKAYEIAAEYIYKTLYAGVLGEQKEQTNDKIIKHMKLEVGKIEGDLEVAIDFMQKNNFIRAYDFIKDAKNKAEGIK